MDMKVFIDQRGNVVAVVMDMTPPSDALHVNPEKVAQMMSDPMIAESCLLGCPFAAICQTLGNGLAAIDHALDALRTEEDMMTGPGSDEPTEPLS